MKLYVKNLSYFATRQDLRQLFGLFGTVLSVNLVTDKFGRSKGYGFVEMENEEEGSRIINELNKIALNGREIIVSVALPSKKIKVAP